MTQTIEEFKKEFENKIDIYFFIIFLNEFIKGLRYIYDS